VSDTFYILLAATVAVSAIPLVATLWKGRHLGSFPVVILSMWLYFYGYMAANAAQELSFVLPPWVFEFGQLISLGGVVALMLGWYLGMRSARRARERRTAPPFSPIRLWTIGMLLIAAGSASHYLFISQADVNFKSTSAYWYMLYHITYPGATLCVIAAGFDARLRRPLTRILFMLAVVIALLPHVANARRGPVFPMMIALVFVPAILRKSRARLPVVGGLAAAGAAMLLFLAVRPFVGNDVALPGQGKVGAWSDAMEDVTFNDVFVKRTHQIGDNEYIYHCAIVATLEERACYQYGTSYISVLLNWIPRALWPKKPGLGEGWYRPHVTEVVSTVTGWDMTSGAAAGGVAEVYNEFGPFSMLVWAGLGFIVARWYRRTLEAPSPPAIAAYVGVLCASHWLISQGVAAAFVPFAIYEIVPALAFRIARLPREARGMRPLRTTTGQILGPGPQWPNA
jgi:hypothetical protein